VPTPRVAAPRFRSSAARPEILPTDFYRTGVHRAHDAFGQMEKNHIESSGAKLARNIDHFGFLKRPIDEAETKFYSPVRGPQFGSQ